MSKENIHSNDWIIRKILLSLQRFQGNLSHIIESINILP